mmetsp:Transcript_38508/g.80697  ORF Transcript_38508/g.80697 Transcript_38508/m.80697 type:complete len:893 (-) Transcript_38508:126-2804(-)
MNSRPINSDDHELPPSSSSTRVSASSRFSRPPTALYASSTPTNSSSAYRAISPASSRASAKSGMNGNSSRGYEDDEEEELGLSSRSAIRSAAKRSSNNTDVKKDYRLERSRSSSSTTSSLSNSGKDRPWRTATGNGSAVTRGTSGYVTANNDVVTDYGEEGDVNNITTDMDDDDDQDELNESYDVEVTSNRWSQYETQDLAVESRRATSNAVVDMASKIADKQEAEETVMMISPHKTTMGGSTGAGLYHDDPNNLEGSELLGNNSRDRHASSLERNGKSLAPPPPANNNNNTLSSSSRSTTNYVKSRLSALVTHRKSNSQSDLMMTTNDYDYDRKLSSTSSTQSDHDKVRNEALKMLEIADSCLLDSPHSRSTSPRISPTNGNGTTGLFRTAGGGLAMRELHDDEVNTIKVSNNAQGNKKKGIASIAGLDKFRSTERGKGAGGFDGTFTIGSQDEEDRKNSNSNGTPISPNEETPSAWSSRYSVERQLMAITGGLDSTHMLAKMDMLHSSREKTKSARGMYRASGYAMDGSHEEYNDYTKTSSSGVGLGGIWLWLRGTLWSDDLELNHDGTTQSLVRREKAMQRRRRFRWGAASLMVFMVLVGVLAHIGNHPRKSVAAGVTTAGEGDVDFYVLADEPFDFSDTEQLTRELEALEATSAEFIIHLGNANGDEQSQCKEYGFERAAAVLKESAVPVLVIPGDKDWAACGSKKKAERSLEYWDVNLGKFVEHWNHPLKVDYSEDVVGNFAFLHKDVLFVSVSIVDAPTEASEVRNRLKKNVAWTKQKLAEYGSDGYRVLVIFGHARPSEKQNEYFSPLVEEVKGLNKPVLYLHANSSGSFQQYTPFDDAENFKAVQLEKRGREAPMRVVVLENGEDGDDTFVFERRDPTMERIEK